MGRIRRVVSVVVALSPLGCGVMQHRLERSYASSHVGDFQVDRRYVERVDAYLEVADVEVEGTRLTGRVEPVEWCVRVSVGSHRVEERERQRWVNASGEPVSLGGIGASEMALGAAMPLLVPLCMTGVCDDDDDDFSSSNRTLDAETLKIGAIAGAIAGGVMFIAGLVDVAADGAAGTTGRVRVRREPDLDRSEPYRCPSPAPPPERVRLELGAGAIGVPLAGDGGFEVDLAAAREAILADPSAAWSVRAEDGTRAPIELPLAERYRVAGRLEAQPVAPPVGEAEPR